MADSSATLLKIAIPSYQADPLAMREAYGMWRNRGLYSFCFWAFDQFCLNSRPVPLEVPSQATATLATYRRPRAARSPEAPIAVAYAPEPSSRMNTCRLNTRRLNGQ